MEFQVSNVSRGYVYLESDEKKAVAEGEGLLPKDKDLPSYVVYLNSIFIIENTENRVRADSVQTNAIVKAIKSYFEKRGSIVVFE